MNNRMCGLISTIESADSICRDSVDTQWMIVQHIAKSCNKELIVNNHNRTINTRLPI